jgi:hypothetical protein
MLDPLLVCTAQDVMGFTLIHGSAVTLTRVIPMMFPMKLPGDVDVSYYITVMNMDSDDAITYLASNPDNYNGSYRERCAAYASTLGLTP